MARGTIRNTANFEILVVALECDDLKRHIAPDDKAQECIPVLRDVLIKNDPNSIELAEAGIIGCLQTNRFLIVSALKSATLKATNLPSRSAGLIFDLVEIRESALLSDTPTKR